MDSDLYDKLVKGEGLSVTDELLLLKNAAKSNPGMMTQIAMQLLKQRRSYQKQLAKAKLMESKAEAKEAKAAELLEKVTSPPLHPAIVRSVTDRGYLDVVCDGRRVMMTALGEVDLTRVESGDEVLLDADSGTVVAHSAGAERAGVVGMVSECTGGQILVRGSGDEEMVAMTTPELAETLKSGDRVIYAREFPFIFERLPERKQSSFVLEGAPAETFRDIGGLATLVDEVQTNLELHLRHGELVEKYGLALLRGLTLVGAPGVGKTLFAKAMANFLAGLGVEASFMHVKPGSLRGIYYGQAEARIRELFAVAKSAPGLVVMFFDELDSYGTRGAGIGQDIDGRVLGALLAEIDGLESAANILCIGATNRLDLCDAALVRCGRMGDRIYTIPRPGRQATREILARYLVEELTYAEGRATDLADAATSYLHAADGGAGTIATVTLRGGEPHEIRARHLLSGALLASAVERAKHSAAQRELESVSTAAEADGGEQHGLRFDDLFTALDHAIAAEAEKLSVPHVARQMLEIPRAEEIARVDITVERRINHHRHLRAA